MNILVIGSGGREHAICATFAKSSRAAKIYCAPGNAGIAEIAECVAIKPEQIERLIEFARTNAVDLTFVGGESALALGIVDEFEKYGLRIVGASKQAARLEASKSFAKDFMKRHGIPTAKYSRADSPAEAIEILMSGMFGDDTAPVVVKADGLAAGKGVVVAKDRAKAISAINDMENLVGANAASSIVLEECLFGREVSLLMFADGENFALMPPTRDHKRIGEGDTGPNTGGMGTITDSTLLTKEQTNEVIEKMIKPTLAGCAAEGFPFRGILFLGLMMSEPPAVAGGFLLSEPPAVADGFNSGLALDSSPRASAAHTIPMLLEYNVRFGDPETQSILVRLESDLVDICEAILNCRSPHDSKGVPDGREDALTDVRASASGLCDLDIQWKPGNSATIVLASKGYPENPQTGDVIHGVENISESDVSIFHAGTTFARDEGGRMNDEKDSLDSSLIPHPSSLTPHPSSLFLTSGGRVLGITAVADNLDNALAKAYAAVESISWDGMQYRRDIGSDF